MHGYRSSTMKRINNSEKSEAILFAQLFLAQGTFKWPTFLLLQECNALYLLTGRDGFSLRFSSQMNVNFSLTRCYFDFMTRQAQAYKKSPIKHKSSKATAPASAPKYFGSGSKFYGFRNATGSNRNKMCDPKKCFLHPSLN